MGYLAFPVVAEAFIILRASRKNIVGPFYKQFYFNFPIMFRYRCVLADTLTYKLPKIFHMVKSENELDLYFWFKSPHRIWYMIYLCYTSFTYIFFNISLLFEHLQRRGRHNNFMVDFRIFFARNGIFWQAMFLKTKMQLVYVNNFLFACSEEHQ